jgi:hypothetical protein
MLWKWEETNVHRMKYFLTSNHNSPNVSNPDFLKELDFSWIFIAYLKNKCFLESPLGPKEMPADEFSMEILSMWNDL